MTHPWTVALETVTRTAPFGVRFRDGLAGAFVSDGLLVEVYPAGQRHRRVAAGANNSGVFTAHGLPGMSRVEFDGATGPARKFVIEVTDSRGRFGPFTLAATLPVAGGLVPWDAGRAVPLFPAGTRAVPAGVAAVRADLWDPVAGRPAAWAVLAARPGTRRRSGPDCT